MHNVIDISSDRVAECVSGRVFEYGCVFVGVCMCIL